MRATNMPTPGLRNFMTGTEDDVAQMMRHRMPQLLLFWESLRKSFQQLAQLPKVLVRVASVTMDGVVIIPAHLYPSY
jgi:hypothetical protein